MTPILFVPGLLCSAEVFAPQAASLWRHGPVTIASTLEGDSIPEIASAILSTAPPRFALVGISMGGYICFEIMRQAPDRVTRLALLDTSARPDTAEQIQRRRALVAQARSGDFGSLLAQVLPTILHPAHRNDADLLAINVRMGLTVGVDGFARQAEALIARPDSRADLPAISVPVLILVGDCDPLTPPDHSEEISKTIRGARLVVIPECGHGSTLEQPEAVNRALEAWLES